MYATLRYAVSLLVLSTFLASGATGQWFPKKEKAQGNANNSALESQSSAELTAGTPQTSTGPKMRIAVMDLSGSALQTQTTATSNSTTTTIAIPPPADFARGMTEMLTTALAQSGRFVVLERTAIDRVVAEQDLGSSGRVNAGTAPAVGKIIGAQTLITGDITEFSYNQNSYGGKFSPLQSVTGKLEKVNATVALDLRVLDATTGEVLTSQVTTGRASMSGVSSDITHGNQSFSIAAAENTPLGKATRHAINDAVAAIIAGMKKVPWSARVIDVRSGSVYINAGSDLGVQPGMQFDIYESQEPLVDPDTGKTLGTPERKIAAATVNTVQGGYSIAQLVSGQDVKRNNIVRLHGQDSIP